VGEKQIEFQTVEGKPIQALVAEHPETNLVPRWKITKEERVQLDADGNLVALQGEATIQEFQDSPQIKDFCLLTL